MKKFQITFYARETDKPIAAAIAEGKDAKDAGEKAYEFLKDKYPTIRQGESFALEGPFPQDVSQSPVAFPDE